MVDYLWLLLGQVASQMISISLSTHPLLQTLMKNIPSLKRTASLHLKKGWLEYYCWWLKSGIHQLIWSIYHYSQGFIHPRWLFGISSINSSFPFLGWPFCRGYVLLSFREGKLINRNTQRTTAPMRLKHTHACWYTQTCQRRFAWGEFPSSWKRTKKTSWWLNQPLGKKISSKWLRIFPQFSGRKFQPARRPPERTGKFLLPKRPFSNLSFPWRNPCFSAVGFVCLCFSSLAWWVVYVV